MIYFRLSVMSRSLVLVVFIAILSPILSRADTPAVFILGDSLYDVGTNSYVLRTIAKANFPYYGIDFFNSSPNGRFCNGQNLADFTTKIAFGETVTSPPPFRSLIGPRIPFSEMLEKAIDFDPTRSWEGPIKNFNFASMGTKENPARGINFASSGCGVMDEASALDQAVSMTEQLSELAFVHGNLTKTLGPEVTQLLFAKSAFFLCVGNNDINFYALFRLKFEPKSYIEKVVQTYNKTVRTMYNLGARKFGIFGVPYVGCAPLLRVTIKSGNCSKTANDMAIQFNARLEQLLGNLTIQLKGMVYLYASSYDVLYEFLEYPERYNFKYTHKACCGMGRFNALSNCNPLANLCEKRHEYVFWDVSHPTQQAAKTMIERFAFSGTKYARPINWAKLVDL